MELLQSTLFVWLFKLLVVALFIYLMKNLVEVGLSSFRKGKGSLMSVIHEILIAILYIAGFAILVLVPPYVLVMFLVNVITFGWGLLAPILRNYLNLPV